MAINKFTTLLDLSRQAKILTGETATFDGKISLGIPFSGYPTGVDTATTVSLGVISSQTSVFSGGTGTTIFDVSNIYSPNYNPSFAAFSATTWSNTVFSANTSGLTLPITILSADTQIIGPFWTLTQTGYTGDYIIGTQYTGYSVTYSFNSVSTISSPNTFSGFTTASQEIFSAGTLDYKGPLDYLYSAEDATIKGRLTTDKLTIQNGASSATTNYLLTQVDDTGKAEWTDASSLLSGLTIWTAGTGTNSAVLGGSNGIASGSTSVSEGVNTTSGGIASHAEGAGTKALGDLSHAEGEDTIASNTASHAEGTNTIASGVYSHAEGSGTIASNARSHAEGYQTTAIGDSSHSEGSGTIASGATSHAEGSYTIAGGATSHAEGSYTIAGGASSHAEGDSTIAGGASSHAEGDSSIAIGIASHAEGYFTLSSGDFSHTEGYLTTASGNTSHAEGRQTNAFGNWSHAEGYGSIAYGDYSHAEGDNTNASGSTSHAEGSNTSAIGIYSHAEGYQTTASGQNSHAEGNSTIASGPFSHTEGYVTIASGNHSHAEGNSTIASGDTSHAEGYGSIASGDYSHAEGFQTIAISDYSHAEGRETTAGGDYSHAEGYLTTASGYASHAEGLDSIASGSTSHAEGISTTAGGTYSHAEGSSTIASGQISHAEGDNTIASGAYSHSEGYYTIASGTTSHAEGYQSTASGYASHAEGEQTIASGDYSHAEGYQSTASGNFSHAEGIGTIASGTNSHAEGYTSHAEGDYSHAEGKETISSGITSHAEGFQTIASGDRSHAEGYLTISSGNNSHAGGYLSVASGDTSFVHGENSIATNTNTIVFGKNITGTTSETLYTNNLIIDNQDGLFGSKLGINTSSPQYVIDANGNSARLLLADTYTGADAPFKGFVFSGNSNNVPQIAASTSNISGGFGLALQMGVLGNNITPTSSTQLLGTLGDTYLVSSQQTNNLNIVNRNGGSGTNHIRMYAGVNSVTAAPNSDFHIQGDGVTRGYIGIKTDNPEYLFDARGHLNNRILYDPTFAGNSGNLTMSATTGLPTIGVGTNTGVVNQNGGISIGMRAWNDSSWATYGKQGDSHLYSSKQSNGLVIISSDGVGTEDYIECYVGGDANGSGALAIHMHGLSGPTKGFVGFDTNLPTERLDVNGNGRFRSIGSTASAGALHYTSDGTLTTNTSDERLKTNITTLTGALSKVNQLRGVSYNWTENPTGVTRIGFIAQEVNSIVSELTFTNPNSPEQYMGVHYDNVTALLVESVKELFSGVTTSNNDFKPQTLTIPLYTPTSSNDTYGSEGNITRDDNYMYVKTITGWKRTNLENF